MIPFIGTTLGAAFVFFAKRRTGKTLNIAIEGFSAGVMIAASVWSLLIPSIELSEKRGIPPAIPPTVGFLLGVTFFLCCDALLFNPKKKTKNISEQRTLMTCFAIALHNLPEGMAVGAVFAELLCVGDTSLLPAAMALSIGIAVQNLPEGAVVSIPLFASGRGKGRSFFLGALSGVIEPIGAALTILAAGIAVPVLPYLLGFAAGAMIYAVIDGFINTDATDPYPTFKNKATTLLSLALGFCVMMSLDVLLS